MTEINQNYIMQAIYRLDAIKKAMEYIGAESRALGDVVMHDGERVSYDVFENIADDIETLRRKLWRYVYLNLPGNISIAQWKIPEDEDETTGSTLADESGTAATESSHFLHSEAAPDLSETERRVSA